MASPRSGESPSSAFGVGTPRWRNRAALRWYAVFRRTNSTGTVSCQADPGQTQVRQTLARHTLARTTPTALLCALQVPCPGGRACQLSTMPDIRRRQPSSLNCTGQPSRFLFWNPLRPCRRAPRSQAAQGGRSSATLPLRAPIEASERLAWAASERCSTVLGVEDCKPEALLLLMMMERLDDRLVAAIIR